MNCEAFDKAVSDTLDHYQGAGQEVQLFSASDRIFPSLPPLELTSVTVVVWNSTLPNLPPITATWNYGGLVPTYTTHPGGPPLGVRPIDHNRLISACQAARALADSNGGGFPVDTATCTLAFPLTPSVTEPIYTFEATLGSETLAGLVGGYSGKILNNHPVAAAA